MADIAVVFHWPLTALDDLDLLELSEWRECAAVRTQREGD
ncbi:MAG: GpE family phage tail protein [Proteobacteria bacterium]|nr:GpE family phage tail protein [Pseudomonadota bacterium]